MCCSSFLYHESAQNLKTILTKGLIWGIIYLNKITMYEEAQNLEKNEILEKLEKAREHAAQGMYKDAYDASHDMRAKYGL